MIGNDQALPIYCFAVYQWQQQSSPAQKLATLIW